MSNIPGLSKRLLISSCVSAFVLSGAIRDAAAAPVGAIEEVIVTARKREESILKVPVTETVITTTRLENLHVTEVADLPKLVPGLVLGRGAIGIGTLLSIRGVGTTTQDTGVDSSVAFNVDGMSMANGLAFESSLFDLAQVEVLKGPQALFYGKNSPGGIISIRTADPTDELEIMGRAGYEAEAETRRGEFIASGPVTDTLRLRLATMYSDSEGYFENKAIPDESTGAVAPDDDREPGLEQYIVRGTALWDPSEKFNARIKLNLVHDEAVDRESAQFTNCPDGTAPLPGVPDFIGGGEDCKLDDTLRIVHYNPAVFPGIAFGGKPVSDTDQLFSTVELNYDIAPELTLNSTTGWYDMDNEGLFQLMGSSYAAPPLSASIDFSREDFTQEFRLTSDYSTPVNYTLGVFYQDGEITPHPYYIANRNMFPPVVWPLIDVDTEDRVSIDTVSAFGQLRWEIASDWELAGGARWTDEEREQKAYDYITGTVKPTVEKNISDTNVSPEATLTYSASDNVTLYAAYREGFKSGSFGLTSINVPVINNAFDSEEAQGGEFGLKSIVLDNQLAFNASTYYYEYDGLQVGAVDPQGGTVGIRTLNAGGAEIYGVEIETMYHPAAIEGLSLNLALNWNHGRYTELDNVPCWGGQLISEGCNQRLDPKTGRYTAQDLDDTQMARAPDWQGVVGFTYEVSIGHGYTLAFTNSNSYSDEYPTALAVGRPGDDQYQDSYWKVDLGMTLKTPAEHWEFALIGKNINDEIIGGFCNPAAFQAGVGVFAPKTAGGTTRGIDGVDEMQCNSEPGREIWLQMSYRL